MSSRVLRGGAEKGASRQPGETAPPISFESIAWRKPANAAQAVAGGARPRESTPANAQQAAADLEKAMEARAAAFYQQGFAAGETAGSQRANAKLEPVLAGLSAVINELAGTRRRFRNEAEEATVGLAIAIARRLLNRELATDPEAILGLVKAAFQKCDARETYKLRLSAADVEAVRGNRGLIALPPAVEIIADAGLTRGSAVFETSRGELDASVDTQLAEIEQGFADILHRRTHLP
ncbi:MAG TPA: FliH/SctL family protein [Bryobacteraceae bacterium]|jgi:flagellar assembly protein FliH